MIRINYFKAILVNFILLALSNGIILYYNLNTFAVIALVLSSFGISLGLSNGIVKDKIKPTLVVFSLINSIAIFFLLFVVAELFTFINPLGPPEPLFNPLAHVVIPLVIIIFYYLLFQIKYSFYSVLIIFVICLTLYLVNLFIFYAYLGLEASEPKFFNSFFLWQLIVSSGIITAAYLQNKKIRK